MVEKIIKFYDNYNEDNRLEKSKSRMLEFMMTVETVAPFIKSDSSIIEIGAGTGKYSLHFASKGCTVKAVEIVPKQVDLIKAKGTNYLNKNLDVLVGDARKLNGIENNSFDLVLCLGPFYYLRDSIDRHDCLNECKRIVKDNGIIAIAYINKYFAIATYLKYGIYLGADILNQIIYENQLSETNMDDFLDVSYFSEPEIVEKQISEVGLEVIDHIGLDGLYNLLESQIENMNEEQFQTFCTYHKKTCRNTSILGYSNHGLVICKKQE